MSRHTVKLKNLAIVDVKKVWFHDVEGGVLVMGVVVGDSLQPTVSLNHGSVLFPEVLLLLQLNLPLWNLMSGRSGRSWDHSPMLLLLCPVCGRLFACDLVCYSTSRQQLLFVRMIVLICFLLLLLLLLKVLSCFFLISDYHLVVAFVVDCFLQECLPLVLPV